MKKNSNLYSLFFTSFLFLGCNHTSQQTLVVSQDSALSCESNLPSRFAVANNDCANISPGKVSHEGMVFINGGEFLMGATDAEGRPDESPQHKVQLDGFWIDATDVTNKQFEKFVDATGYITTAEKIPD